MSHHIHVARRRILTTKQMARELNVHESTVALWCESGLIKPYDQASTAGSRFAESDVMALRDRLSKGRWGSPAELMRTG